MQTYKTGASCFFLAVIAIALLGCSQAKVVTDDAADKKASQYLAPQWTEALTLPALLADTKHPDGATIATQKDIHSRLSQSWYASINVQHAKHPGITSLDNCVAYFNNKTPVLRAQRDNEQSAFLELQLACEAARLMANAKTSKKSFLPKHLLTQEVPNQLPKSLAFVTSQTEFEKLQNDASKHRWGDVNAIRHFEQTSPYQARYSSDSGVQKLGEIGRGDINHDGVQDILLLSEDSVEGGSYFNLRLFVLTVDENGQWKVLEQY